MFFRTVSELELDQEARNRREDRALQRKLADAQAGYASFFMRKLTDMVTGENDEEKVISTPILPLSAFIQSIIY